MFNQSVKSDVIIVGGGISAIVAALELLNFGRSVTIFDQAPEEQFGGLAPWSFGGLFFADSPTQRKARIPDTVDLAYNDWLSTARFGPEDVLPKEWAKAYVYNSTPIIYHWLTELGIKFFPFVNWIERGLFTSGNSVPRFHIVWGTGYELARVLIGHLKNHPKASTHLKILHNHRVEEIQTEGGQVVGVAGKNLQTGGDFTSHAQVTVVATGGMGGNVEKVRQHWPSQFGTPPETLLNGASPFIDGSGIDACERIDAKITHLDWIWPYAGGIRHPKPRFPNHGLSTIPPRSALWMNYQGKRMGPMPVAASSFDTQYAVERICQEEKKFAWQILNKKILLKEFAVSGSEHNVFIRDKNILGFLKILLLGNRVLADEMMNHCEDFVVANTLDELVNKMNNLMGNQDVDGELLKREVRQYDAMIRRGKKFHNDDQLRRIAQLHQYLGDKLRLCHFQPIEDDRAGPLIAIRSSICLRKTLGGIQTDLRSRVTLKGSHGLNPDCIPNLYAIGEAAGYGGGGMNGRASLEGTFLGGCLFSARVAAYDIVGKSLY